VIESSGSTDAMGVCSHVEIDVFMSDLCSRCLQPRVFVSLSKLEANVAILNPRRQQTEWSKLMPLSDQRCATSATPEQ